MEYQVSHASIPQICSMPCHMPSFPVCIRHKGKVPCLSPQGGKELVPAVVHSCFPPECLFMWMFGCMVACFLFVWLCVVGTPAHTPLSGKPPSALLPSTLPSRRKPLDDPSSPLSTCFQQPTQECLPRGSAFDCIWAQSQLLADTSSALTKDLSDPFAFAQA